MKLTTIHRMDHSNDVPLWIPAPEPSDDPETLERKRRMQEKLEWAKALLGSKYVLHPSQAAQRSAIPFQLEKSR